VIGGDALKQSRELSGRYHGTSFPDKHSLQGNFMEPLLGGGAMLREPELFALLDPAQGNVAA
jgi:hypothetical protein